MRETLSAEIVTVYRAPDGAIHHRRCGRRLTLHGQRARLEVDFYCYACAESVTLPICVLANIPEGPQPLLTLERRVEQVA